MSPKSDFGKPVWLCLLMMALASPALAASVERLEAEGDWAAALGVHLAALDKNTNDAKARHGAWRAAMRLGLYEQAAALGATIDTNEQEELAGDRTALKIRYGKIDARTLTGAERYRWLDQALADSEAAASALAAGRPLDKPAQRLLIDRISALTARNRPAEALRLYQALQARQLDIPAWVLIDVAAAYLANRQPSEAEALYRQILASAPDDFEANFGLFYALVEAEKLDEATAHIDAYAARLPARRHRDGRPNGERWSAVVASDQARLYADRLDAASQRIRQHLADTPFNGEVRGAEAGLHLARGWPRRGEADLRRNLGSDPNNPSLHADHAEVLLSLQRWDEAAAALERARALAPDASSVRRVGETLALHQRRELSVEAGYGKGQSSSPFGSSDWRVDSWLYSSPLAERWRIFVHNLSASGDFHAQRTDWIRTGVGAEWRSGDWRASGEVNGGEGEKPGLLTTLRWNPDDYWQLDASADSLTNDIPLQAVRAGITAKRIGLGATWRAHESRRFSIGAGRSEFSDGNVRNSVNAAWFERWQSGPRWTLESTLGVDGSRNSLGYAAAYFNPPSDHSAWLAGTVEHLGWRDYDRAFRQRLTLTLGQYWQQDVAGGSIKAVEYQHRWEAGRDLSIRYGIGRSLRPYDGVREARNFGTLTLLWRF